MCYALKYCVNHDLYPLLQDDPGNAYGRWTDYFEPFLEEAQTSEIRQRENEIEVLANNLSWAANRKGLFGENWIQLAGEIKAIFLDIFVLKDAVRHEIQAKIDALELPSDYSSLHIRRGGKNRQFKDYGQLSNSNIVRRVEEELQKKGIRDIFVMTDDYSVIETMRDSTSRNMITMCRPSYDGKDTKVRTAEGHMLDLLTEIAVATQSKFHVQTVNSRLSKIVRLLRDDRNCHHVFDESYNQYTAL